MSKPSLTHLTPEQRHVTQEKGTERAFTGPHLSEKRAGRYKCVCCGQDLFDARTKYESGTGWPSFWDALPQAVTEKDDRAFFMRRTEIVCAGCSAHLGHVFPDGPEPTGLRYCMNGQALDFSPEGDDRPEKS